MQDKHLDHIDITPNPRVLRVLGEIKFEAWQCLAELVDNSIDSFTESQQERIIQIQLPERKLLNEDVGEIVVEDNGPGMNREQLQKAVRAGYSGNNPRDKLGLFGMGFNVSTARLGKCTEVWTTTADSKEWIGVRIDFFEIEKANSYITPLLTEPKSEEELGEGASGTKVRVSKLNTSLANSLTRGAGKSSAYKKLGRIYSRAIKKAGVKIYYGGERVLPYEHCIWDKTRAVTRGSEQIPAYLEIDEELPADNFCDNCLVWLQDAAEECMACGTNDNVHERSRHIKGWVGVQRYFDPDHFGIDLVRNGRVIEELDKSLFNWTDPRDGLSHLEYPLEVTYWGGRIVGELEINFVEVSYKKDGFDKHTPEWREVIKRVRGESPLRPKIAASRGHLPNTTYLARLFKGYNNPKPPGINSLVPKGKSGGSENDLPKKWAERFYDGDPEYRTDAKWYELLTTREGEASGRLDDGDAAGDLPISGDSEETDDANAQIDEASPTPQDGVSRFENDEFLSRTYRLEILSDSPTITVEAECALEGLEGNQAIIFDAKRRIVGKRRAKFQYDPKHPFFEDSLETPLDCLVGSLAHYFKLTSSAREWPFAVVSRDIRKAHFPETLTSLTDITTKAKSMLDSLRQFLDENLAEVSPIDESVIDSQNRRLIQERFLEANVGGDQESLQQAIEGGNFIQFVDNRFLASSVQHWPDLIMDGKFLSVAYSNLPTETAKADRKDMVCNALHEVVWIVDCDLRGAGVTKDQNWRLLFARALSSFLLLEDWRV